MATFTTLYFIIPFFCLVHSAAAEQTSPPYIPTDYILISCGESSNTTSSDGRNWDGDAHSKFSSSTSATKSFASRASFQENSVPQVPYMTARVFPEEFTYTFPVSTGPKFLRLHFHPAPYLLGQQQGGLDDNDTISTSFFTVSANKYTLLRNFSAHLTVSAMIPPVAYFFKEFIISVSSSQMLNLTFSPSSSSSYAFINGIEVVSMPDNLYLQQSDGDRPIPFINSNTIFSFDKPVALETAYRLNVGGAHVSAKDDTGMFREWLDDTNYIYGAAFGVIPHLPGARIKYTSDTPAYIAPVIVYTTSRTMGNDPNINKKYNLTWNFSVDPGFNYLVRLHFCETQLEVTRENQRVFSIFINNQTAENDADVIHWSGGSGIPVFKDYVVWVPIDTIEKESKQDFWLALHPFLDLDPLPKYADAILNGLEIFKLNNSDGNLAGPNPASKPPPEPKPGKQQNVKNNKGRVILIIIIAAVLGSIFALVSLLYFFFLRKKKRVNVNESASEVKTKSSQSWVPFSYALTSTNTNTASSLPSDLCRRFSLTEIKQATCDFADHCIIGSGGFGHVFKGYIDDGSITVAVKRLNTSSMQGAREFRTEIEMISELRHLHIVSLLGFCDEHGEMILVYEFMPRGNLRDHLYNSQKQNQNQNQNQNSPLTWKRRLEISIGAARGLHYLHAGAKLTIIHRDVKSTNILLDENWAAKISDFGLSRMGPSGMSQSHVSTVVKGSFGYVDPEYIRRQQLTEKSDVYSFGVVLLEVLCGRPPMINGAVRKEEVSLVSWARVSRARGTVDQIVDPRLRGKIAPVCLNKFVEIAGSCTDEEGFRRPTMGDVTWGLEFALQLQEAAEKSDQGRPFVPRGEVITSSTTTDSDEPFSGSSGQVSESKSNTTSSGADGERIRVRYENVFSEIMDPKGR